LQASHSSAGAFGSPQILELSGFGSSDIIKRQGIDVLYENKAIGGMFSNFSELSVADPLVLENLQDHLKSAFSYEVKASGNKTDIESAKRAYNEDRTGPLAEQACYTFSYMPLERFLSTSETTKLASSLDVLSQKVSNRSKFEQIRTSFIRKMLETPHEATATAYLSRRRPAEATPNAGNWISLCAMLSRPFSTGNVHV
jgi:choline dehydrogenase-like flavoprotein